MKLSQIANIMLGTTDLERSITFYRDSLGLAIKFQTPGFVFFDTGTVTLCLSEPHSKLGEVPGATEVVFAIDDVREAYADLSARGVLFLSEPANVTGSSWAANFRDPDGHLLSVVGPERKA